MIKIYNLIQNIHSVVSKVVEVAQNPEVKNTMIKSPKVAVIDVKKDAGVPPTSGGTLTFSLPTDSTNNQDLSGCEVGGEPAKENTILLVRPAIK